MLRGDIFLVDFGPSRGSEANKRRPAILVSNDSANMAASRLDRGTVTVVPVTSNVRHLMAFHVLMRAQETGLNADSKAQVEHIRSVSVERVSRRIGHVPQPLMNLLDEAIALHLGLREPRV